MKFVLPIFYQVRGLYATGIQTLERVDAEVFHGCNLCLLKVCHILFWNRWGRRELFAKRIDVFTVFVKWKVKMWAAGESRRSNIANDLTLLDRLPCFESLSVGSQVHICSGVCGVVFDLHHAATAPKPFGINDFAVANGFDGGARWGSIIDA